MITIPKNIKPRTRAKERTIILCFESQLNDVKGTECFCRLVYGIILFYPII